MKRVLIIGATSAIASATARLWALQGASFFLVGRMDSSLEKLKSELQTLGAADVQKAELDLTELDQHEALITKIFEIFSPLDVVLIAHGALGDQQASEMDFSLALSQLNINAISVMSLATYIAQHLSKQGYGTLAAISSVAGDRGRKSNYVYGTAKGALNIFLEGLRHRLHSSNVRVLTIKPGLVDTPMTAHLQKGTLWAAPNTVAKDIIKALERGKDEIYTPWFWKLIMLVIKHLPHFVYKRTNL